MYDLDHMDNWYRHPYIACLLHCIYPTVLVRHNVVLMLYHQDMKRRTDLRHVTICSVDPPGCTDIDDALHCRDLPNGNLEV